jgi:hypothetical protein
LARDCLFGNQAAAAHGLAAPVLLRALRLPFVNLSQK